MEAAKLKKKKPAVSKGKIKKTIKNVICRPDTVFWPAATDIENITLDKLLSKHRVEIPEFKKRPWKEIKSIPKEEREKAPSIQRVDGLLFGISECRHAIKCGDCSAVLLDAEINPQAIVQPIIDACSASDIPIVCIKDLRILSKNYFGIKASCLSIKKTHLQELVDKLQEIWKNQKPKLKPQIKEILKTENKLEITTNEETSLDVDMDSNCSPYLYRTNKKSRVFVPSSNDGSSKLTNRFTGQNYIKLSTNANETKTDSKSYMKMILKKISNNPNRVKLKQ